MRGQANTNPSHSDKRNTATDSSAHGTVRQLAMNIVMQGSLELKRRYDKNNNGKKSTAFWSLGMFGVLR